MGKILLFRTPEKLLEHFSEHGKEVGCETAEEYLIRANAVVENPESKSKHETDEDDFDKIFYLPQTGEIVFVSLDGYLRTYFIADDEYFEKQ